MCKICRGGGGGNVVPVEGVRVGAWVPGEGVFKIGLTQVSRGDLKPIFATKNFSFSNSSPFTVEL